MPSAHAFDKLQLLHNQERILSLQTNTLARLVRIPTDFSSRPIARKSSPGGGWMFRNARRHMSCMWLTAAQIQDTPRLSSRRMELQCITMKNCDDCSRFYRNRADDFYVSPLCFVIRQAPSQRLKAKSLTSQPSSPRTRVGVRLRSRNTTNNIYLWI